MNLSHIKTKTNVKGNLCLAQLPRYLKNSNVVMVPATIPGNQAWHCRNCSTLMPPWGHTDNSMYPAMIWIVPTKLTPLSQSQKKLSRNVACTTPARSSAWQTWTHKSKHFCGRPKGFGPWCLHACYWWRCWVDNHPPWFLSVPTGLAFPTTSSSCSQGGSRKLAQKLWGQG